MNAARKFAGRAAKVHEVVEFYLAREQAERELAAGLRDESAWVDKLAVVLVDFSGAEPVVIAA
jgi:hypothetical protein